MRNKVYLRPFGNPKRLRLLKLTQQGQGSDPLWTFHTVPLSNEIWFIALSYVWGNPQVTESFCLSKKSVTIGKNLADALKHLKVILRETKDSRLRGCKYVWADALCINQSDDEEKSYQVQMMPKIYSSAKATIGWLGSDPVELGDTLRNLAMITKTLSIPTKAVTMPFDRSRSFRKDGFGQFREGIRTGRLSIRTLQIILQNPFWRRVWIMQETVVPKELLYAFGYQTIDWTVLFTTTHIMDEFQSRIDSITDKATYDIVHSVKSPLQLLWRRAKASGMLEEYAFKDLLSMIRGNWVATDPRDLVYALYGVPSKRHTLPNIEIDYSISIKSLYIAIAAEYLESLDWILSNAERPPQTKNDLPSWVPDWRVPALSNLNHSILFNVRRQQQDRSRFLGPNNLQERLGLSCLLNGEILCVEGYQIDTVKIVSLNSFADMHRLDASELWFKEFESMLKLTNNVCPSDLERSRIALKVAIASETMNEYEDTTQRIHVQNWERLRMQNLAVERKGFTTENGYAGIGPKSMKPGDLVCVVEANMPIILTKACEGRLRFLGQAYIYGIMFGRTGMSIVDNLEKQTFALE